MGLLDIFRPRMGLADDTPIISSGELITDMQRQIRSRSETVIGKLAAEGDEETATKLLAFAELLYGDLETMRRRYPAKD